jgi:hypothetical protein
MSQVYDWRAPGGSTKGVSLAVGHKHALEDACPGGFEGQKGASPVPLCRRAAGGVVGIAVPQRPVLHALRPLRRCAAPAKVGHLRDGCHDDTTGCGWCFRLPLDALSRPLLLAACARPRRLRGTHDYDATHGQSWCRAHRIGTAMPINCSCTCAPASRPPDVCRPAVRRGGWVGGQRRRRARCVRFGSNVCHLEWSSRATRLLSYELPR